MNDAVSRSDMDWGFTFSQEGPSQDTRSVGGVSSAPRGLRFSLAGSAPGSSGVTGFGPELWPQRGASRESQGPGCVLSASLSVQRLLLRTKIALRLLFGLSREFSLRINA